MCRALTYIALHERAPFSDVQRVLLGKPSVPIDSRSFVVPALIERGIHSNGNHIAAAVLHIVRDIEAERCVTTQVSADDKTVEENDGVAKYAVELDERRMPSSVAGTWKVR